MKLVGYLVSSKCIIWTELPQTRLQADLFAPVLTRLQSD